MTDWHITFIFKAEQFSATRNYHTPLSASHLLTAIAQQQAELENTCRSSLKSFLRTDPPPPKYSRYLPTTKPLPLIEAHFQDNKPRFIVQFMHQRKDEEVRCSIQAMMQALGRRQRQLGQLNNELKDEYNQLKATSLISRVSDRISSEDERWIEVSLVVVDPLVEGELPVFQDEIDLPSHIERLKKASMSNHNLMIRVRSHWGSREEIQALLTKQGFGTQKISVVQLFTRVIRKKGKLMIAVEKGVGERGWEEATDLLKDCSADLIIVIGVGAYLLREVKISKSLILISTCSSEEKRSLFSKNQQALSEAEPPYNDRHCQVFLEQFYQRLFQRKELEDCFKQAQGEAAKHTATYIWCCCLHEHAEDCSWSQIISKIGQLQAHRIFRHLQRDWNKTNCFQITSLVQSYLVGVRQTCVGQGPCCYSKLGLDRKQLHINQLTRNLLVWNGQSFSGIEPACEQRTNRFDIQPHEKPIGRKRPLTIYKFIQQLLANSILILRSPQIALAKRYFLFAKQYLQARRPQIHFIEVEFNSQVEIRKIINDSIQLIQSSSRLNLMSNKIQLYISMLHNPQKSDKFYDKILNQYPTFASDLKKQHTNVQLRFLLLTCDRWFNDHHPSSWIADPLPAEKYHYILSKTSYEQITSRWQLIRDQIETDNSELPKYFVQEKCDAISKDEKAYEFLGFLAQFSDDGFYLTKSGRIVISHLFSQTVIQQAINGHLPVQHISLNDSIYMQLHKPYHDHFKSPSNYSIYKFTARKLQYYFLLLKLYTDLLPSHLDQFPQAPAPLRRILKGDGLFSVDIANQITNYNQKYKLCLNDLNETGEVNEILFNYNSFRHGYHLAHIQKILNEAIKRRRRNPSSRSALKATEPYDITFLVWNVALKGLILSLTTIGQLKQKAIHFQSVLLIFLVKVDVSVPLAEIGRMQLLIALGRIANKLQDVNFRYMGELLQNLRNYANRQQQLSCLQLQWGNTNKFKELLWACLNFAGKVRDMLVPGEKQQEFLHNLSAYGMFHRFDCQHWTSQIIKMIEKKVLYYFHFTRMLKSISSASSRRQKETQFHKEFKLRWIVYEFRTFSKLLELKEQNQPHRVLINLYLQVLIDQYEIDTTALEAMRGKLSPEYLPIFNHLCNKIEQKTLFNQKGLIICARARPILADGKPCLFTRKRNLTMKYLKRLIEGRALKISYFTLTPNTLNNLQKDSTDTTQNKCEMLMLILTVDAPIKQALLFGSDLTIEGQKVSLSTFADQLLNCRIKILILCGKNSSHVCDYLQQAYTFKSLPCPALISIQSSTYSLCDALYNHSTSNGWAYLCNEVSQIAADLLILSLVAMIKKSITGNSCLLNEQFLKQKIVKSLRMVGQVLRGRFDCAEEVMQQIECGVRMRSEVQLESVEEGVAEDLTARFYSYDSNLLDENYYQNVGRGEEVNRILTAISSQGQRCVQILGGLTSGKSTLLQQICWICQTKSLFRFGIFKYDLNQAQGNSLLTFLSLRDFKQFHNRNSSGLLLALDNVTEKFIESQSALLSRFRGKAVTIIYSTASPAAGLALQKLLQIESCLRVNLNFIKGDEIYGLLMSHIKEREEAVLTKEVVTEFEDRVRNTLKQVAEMNEQQRLRQALKLLRREQNEEDRTRLFLQFYEQNFEALMKLLHNYKQVTLTIT